MSRITKAILEAKVERINSITGSPEETYSEESGKYHANPGNYHLSGAYGGYNLQRVCSDGHGTENVLGCGHVPKKELAEMMDAFIRGLLAKQN